MLRYRVGRGGAALATYYTQSEHVPQMRVSDALAGYYAANPHIGAGVRPEAQTHQMVLDGLGISPDRALTAEELANILAGTRADGAPIAGRSEQAKNAFIDFTFSPPKSFSVALVFASPQEREKLEAAYRTAVDQLIAVISKDVGSISIGDTSRDRARTREPAHLAVFRVEHYTARPTIQVASGKDTEKFELRVAGDPHRHSHLLFATAAFAENGRVGSLYQDGLKDRIKTWGAIGQAFLKSALQTRYGVETELDKNPHLTSDQRMGRLLGVPDWASELFSKRTRNAEKTAREWAHQQGFDFDGATPEDRIRWLRTAVVKSRYAKGDGLDEYNQWQRQAKEAGFEYRSVLRPGREKPLEPIEVRHRKALEIANAMLEVEFGRRAVLEGSVARTAVAKAFIEVGVEKAGEINDVTAAMRTEGVRQDGLVVALHHAHDPASRFNRITTALSVSQENEVIDLLREAAADKSVAISREVLDRAVAKVSQEHGLDFTTPHGRAQRAMMDRIAEGGRAFVGIGVAGSGKSTLMRPLVEAWHAEGRSTWGLALAWRQTDGLIEAGVGRRQNYEPVKDSLISYGIQGEHVFALRPFLRRVSDGRLKLGPMDTVVFDEFALIGTRDLLEFKRLRAKHGFHFVGIGDDKQLNPIEAGAPIDLARRAFGPENVPELTSSIRQLGAGQQEVETVMMWREGRAAEALQRRMDQGRLHIAPGGYSDAVRAAADLWWQLRQTNKNDKKYILAVSAPTNADTQAIAEAIRDKRRAAGEIGPDLHQLMTIDQNPNSVATMMRVASGDRVRLFDRVHGRDPDTGRSAIVGSNGSVVTVIQASGGGMVVQKSSGGVAHVTWDALRREAGPVRLAYGDAVTINARQSDTVTDHITVMPAGSQSVNAFAVYSADSRHKRTSHIITSQGAEKDELQGRWPLGDERNQETDRGKIQEYILENMARNLARQDRKTLAVEMMETGKGVQMGELLSDRAFHAEDYEARSARDAARQAAEAEAARLGGLLGEREETLARADEALNAFDAWREQTEINAEAAAVIDGNSTYSEALDALAHRVALPTTANLEELDARVEQLGDRLRDAIEQMEDGVAEKAQRGPQITQEERNRIAERHVASTSQQQVAAQQHEQIRRQERQQDRGMER